MRLPAAIFRATGINSIPAQTPIIIERHRQRFAILVRADRWDYGPGERAELHACLDAALDAQRHRP